MAIDGFPRRVALHLDSTLRLSQIVCGCGTTSVANVTLLVDWGQNLHALECLLHKLLLSHQQWQFVHPHLNSVLASNESSALAGAKALYDHTDAFCLHIETGRRGTQDTAAPVC